MVDHYEMRQAYLRAIQPSTIDFNLHQCNICGNQNDDIGKYVFLKDNSLTYKMWNCQTCLDEEKEEALV